MTADEAPRSRSHRTPVLELTHHGPMGSPYYPADLGTSVPEFLLYEDGLVIYVDGEGSDAQVRQARLSADEVYALLDRAQPELEPLPSTIEASTMTDQPAATIEMFHGNRHTRVGVYGIDRQGAPVDAEASVPASFVDLYQRLQSFEHPEAQPWAPDEIEIVMWRTDERGQSTAWPQAVPLPPAGAREPRPFSRPGRGTSYRRPIVYRVDGDLEASITDALQQHAQITPVEWNGQPWLVRTRRVIDGFPLG